MRRWKGRRRWWKIKKRRKRRKMGNGLQLWSTLLDLQGSPKRFPKASHSQEEQEQQQQEAAGQLS